MVKQSAQLVDQLMLAPVVVACFALAIHLFTNHPLGFPIAGNLPLNMGGCMGL